MRTGRRCAGALCPNAVGVSPSVTTRRFSDYVLYAGSAESAVQDAMLTERYGNSGLKFLWATGPGPADLSSHVASAGSAMRWLNSSRAPRLCDRLASSTFTGSISPAANLL